MNMTNHVALSGLVLGCVWVCSATSLLSMKCRAAEAWQPLPPGVTRLGSAADVETFSFSLTPSRAFMNGNLPRMGASADLLFAKPKDATDSERILFEAQGADADDRHHEKAVELRPLLRDAEGELFELMPLPVKMLARGDPRYKGTNIGVRPGSWRAFTTGNWFSGEAGAASHGLYAVSGADGDRRPTGRLLFLGFRLHVVRDADLPEPTRPVAGTLRLAGVRLAGRTMLFERPFVYMDNVCTNSGRYRFRATVTDDFQARPAHGVDQVVEYVAGGRVRLEIPTGADGVHWIRWSLSAADGTELVADSFRTQTLGGDGVCGQPVPKDAVFRVEHAGRGVYAKGEPFEMTVEGARGADVTYVLEPACARDVLAEGTVPADGKLRFPRFPGIAAYRLRLARRANGTVLETAEFLFGEKTDPAARLVRPGRLITRHELKAHPYNRLTYHLSTRHRGRHDLAWQVADFERLVKETRAWNQNFTIQADLGDFVTLDGVYDFTLLDRYLETAADWGVKLTVKLDHADWYAGQYRWQKFSFQYSFDRTVCGQDNPCGVFAATDPRLAAFFTAANRALFDRYRDHVAFQGYYVCQPASEFTVVDQPWAGSISGYSPEEERGFRDFLRRKYGTLAALNARWETAYADWAEIRSPHPAFRLGPVPDLSAPWVDFSRWKQTVADDWYCRLIGSIRAFDTNRVTIAYGEPRLSYAGLLDFAHNGGNALMGERGAYADAWYKGRVGWITEPLHPQQWAASHVPGAGGWTLDASVWTMLAQAGAGGANLHLYSFMDFGEKSHIGLETAQDRMRRYETILEEIHDTRLVQPLGEIASYAGADTLLLKHRAYFTHRLADLGRWLELIPTDGFRASKLESFPDHPFKLVVPNVLDEVISAAAYSNIVRQVTAFGATCLMAARTGRYVSEFGWKDEFPLLKALGIPLPKGEWTTAGDFHATAAEGCPLFDAGKGFDIQTLTKLRREESDPSILRNFGSYPYRWIPETDYFGAYAQGPQAPASPARAFKVLATFDRTGAAALTLHRAGKGRVLVFWGLPAMTGGALAGMMRRAAAFAGVAPTKAEVGDFFELHGDESGRHYGFFFLETTYGARRLVFPNCPDGRYFADDMVADRKYGSYAGRDLREHGIPVVWEKGQSPLKALRLIPVAGKVFGGMYDVR